MVKCLLGRGAEVNKADNNGVTPLLYASCNGHLEVVQACWARRQMRTRPVSMMVDSIVLGLL